MSFFLTPENITDSLQKRNNLDNTDIFGYSKLVIKRIISFTTKTKSTTISKSNFLSCQLLK